MNRTIGVVTVGRSDYGITVPILRAIQREPGLRLHLIVSGMHLSETFGLTVREIEADGFPIGARVPIPLTEDTPEAIAAAIGVAVTGFARTYAAQRPDLLVVLGDRFEMYAAAVAALPMTIPVAHLHGGELTQGAMDDALRHSLTKLSHLHFVATQDYAHRVMQLGEEPWRVVVSGAPSLDHLKALRVLTPQELGTQFGLRCETAPLLVTYHPVTLEYERTEWQITELLAALEGCERPTESFDCAQDSALSVVERAEPAQSPLARECRAPMEARPVIFTMPNADTHGRVIRRLIAAFVARHPTAQAVENLGTQGYFSLMACGAAMVGNSSSGLIEAPSFSLPVVNIGTRQQGRIRAENVIDVDYPRGDIQRGLAKALSSTFRASLHGLVNPYGEGHAAEIIVKRLTEVPLHHRLIQKRFVDLWPVPIEQESVAHG